DVPSPVNPPPGCRFHTRCWLYESLGRPDVCRAEEPPLREVRPQHFAACHFAEDALRSDIGVAHLDETAKPAAAAAAGAAAATA
ncbi:MAG: dipeptide/oligopeptide/nickel ABC transporter ATP-binding protein, partial [Candidatus Limnocylindria bacterium]